MRGVFGWGDERIAHYLESVQEQTGWSRELVLQDAEHACDEGPEALEPWRADAYLGPVPADPELAEIETMVCSKLRAVAWSDEEIVRWQRNIQRINRWSREQALREAQAMAFALSEDNVSPEVWETPEEIARSAAFEAWSAECREMNAALAKAHKVYVNAPPHERRRLKGLDVRIVASMHLPRCFGFPRMLGRSPRSRRVRSSRTSRGSPAREPDKPHERELSLGRCARGHIGALVWRPGRLVPICWECLRELDEALAEGRAAA